MRIAETTVLKPENISYRERDGEGVLYDSDSRNIHVLNKTALMVWNLCEEAERPQDIATSIADKFGVPTARVIGDVMECLNRFEELGIIKRVAI